MSVSAEPTPAQLPLPGGRAGATVRLHPLLSGEIGVPPGFLERRPGRLATLRVMRTKDEDRVWLPVPAFLVEHPGAGPVLVDTGLHPSVALDPTQSFGRTMARLLPLRMSGEQAVAEHLRTRGISPGEVGVVLMTHLHTDHASAVCEFPGATFVVDAREWSAATAGRGLLRGYRTAQFDFGFDWRTVDYESPEIDSYATFGGSVDLFGDGSVRLLATPGHSAGHQSVLLRLRDREALITGDAVYERRAVDADVEPLVMDDEHRYRRSLKEIRAYVQRTPNALVITGHDPREWPRLAAVYD